MKLDSLSILATPAIQCVVYIIMIKLSCYVLVLAMLRMHSLMIGVKSVIPLGLLEL